MTESDSKTALGRRIARLRKKKGLSQTGLANQVNLDSGGRAVLTQNIVSRIELGTREVPLVEGMHIATALGTTVEDLVAPDTKGVEQMAAAAAGNYRRAVEKEVSMRKELEHQGRMVAAHKVQAAAYWRHVADQGDTRLTGRVRTTYEAAGLGDVADGTVSASDLDPFKEN